MSKIKKILIATTTRADFGIISEIIQNLQKSKKIRTKILVTGTHLHKNFGNTKNEIIEQKIKYISKIKILEKNFSDLEISKYFSNYIKKTSIIFKNFKPDLFFATGDRYEMFAITLNALIFRTPVAHLHGGETTIGVIDNQIRNCISQLSKYHFVIHSQYKKKLISMGHNENRIFDYGSPVISKIKKKKYLFNKKKLINILKIDLKKKYYLVTFHPENMKKNFKKDIDLLLKSLLEFKNFNFIFTSSNADHLGNIFSKKIQFYCKKNKNFFFYSSLGQKTYLSLMKYSNGVIGNSSSGVIEAQALKVPCINIGKRQHGRILAGSVINTNLNKHEIEKSIKKTNDKYFRKKFKYFKILFLKRNSSKKIANKIIKLTDKKFI